MSKKNCLILVGGAPRTIWDHIKPKNGPKKGPKNSQKRAKIGQDRPKIGPRLPLLMMPLVRITRMRRITRRRCPWCPGRYIRGSGGA